MALLSTARSRSRLRGRVEDGYVLLTLLLIVALMGIVAMTVMVPLKFDMQREREQEMIHRGVQYSRAIRNYYKKYGRYPTRLEDLDNTNNLRYLRKHYKDPLTGKDFKLLHYGDPGVSLGGSFGGGVIPGANTVGQLNGSAASGSGSSSFGSSSFGSSNSAFGGSSGFGNSGSAFGGSGANSSGGLSQSSSFGGNSNSGFGGNSNSQTSAVQQGTNTAAGTDPSQAVTQTPGTQAPGTTTAPGDATSSTQTVFGGGPIVGVASISKDKTIREFNHKYKYNEWQFVYDPMTDRGGLLMTPCQPLIQLSIIQPGQNGQPGSTSGSSFGQPSSGQSSFGQSSSFGQGTGFGSGSSGSAPAQPQSSPSQQ
jgi:type II secretory pathway pseudopilin PulG